MSHCPQTEKKGSTNVQNLFHVYKWIHKCGNVYRLSYAYLQIAPYLCEYDFTQHKLKNTFVNGEIFVDRGTHLCIVFCGLQVLKSNKNFHILTAVFIMFTAPIAAMNMSLLSM